MSGMFRAIFSLGGFNRGISLAVGGAAGFAFTNPDEDTVYDLFPLQKPPPYAFISTYKVKPGEGHEFEESWKALARSNQSQEGYLFTKLHRAMDTLGTPQFDYIDVVQWSTGDAYRRASQRPGHQDLVRKLHAEEVQKPLMYSVVVDDTQALTATV
eukprot:TRINITY_DN335_c0_g1_i1.p2 TRINITY_DN335_c0_g1~~TRINITY_DN335_c0_g1_i1.p2  ORF type:complete len:156 (-),score=41.11 TRINITY_DN335_c0_g1_i1:122-589(-)